MSLLPIKLEDGSKVLLEGRVRTIQSTLPTGYWISDSDPQSGYYSVDYYTNERLAELFWKGELSELRAGSCFHEMKDYLGFTEKYKYCTKCNHKEF